MDGEIQKSTCDEMVQLLEQYVQLLRSGKWAPIQSREIISNSEFGIQTKALKVEILKREVLKD